ncbi:MAG: MFS transporter, partial [Desulfatibacillaceae bacterium]|nr:MFS transporter [Desulfatibacillaceae bacterium]
ELSTIQWVVTIYLLTISCLLLAFGRLSDILGRRLVYCSGLVIFAAGSLACGLSPSAHFLIAFRACQGLGAAMIMACSPALLVDVFPERERGQMLGMIGTVVAAGLTLGPALGGLILKYFSWRVIFFINVPVGLIAVLATMRILRAEPGQRSSEPFDIAGAALLAICLASFMTALSRAGQWGFFSLKAIGLFLAASLCLALFVQMERKIKHPLFDPALLRNRLFTICISSAMALFAAFFFAVFLMPFFLMYLVGYSADQAAVILIIPFFFLFVFAPFFGAVSDRVGSRILCTLGLVLLSVALFSLSGLSPSREFFPLFWRLGLAGTGIAMFLPANSSAALSSVPPRHRGVASGAVATSRNLGMVVGVALAALIFSARFEAMSQGVTLKDFSPQLADAFISAFSLATFWGGVIALAGAAVASLRGQESLRRTAKKD